MAMARSSTPVSTLDVFRDPAFSGFSFGGLGDAVSLYSPELTIIGARLIKDFEVERDHCKGPGLAHK
ncbi:hypothetical protein P168DRAFT_287692 [Aspergillus campestris IBT 28561]|uniref:Uncharacterized protein n=1 Tax=Aspergillus campestris (strain IBT 28561) TaxID=1392248 RepID=A0A2I1DBE7_ASPC2|nr:uncharacterized protein P168DRAFT_287692 [Aspergillus campestris IBT 28561]PKY07204.1 hypothetical protein P168DRAFT_287692 [Aspergillus campestris IBT 28561]